MAASKNTRIKVTDEKFLSALRHRIYGFSQRTTLQLLTHLRTTYGTVTAADIEENESAMNRPYDPATPIEILFTQIENGADLLEDAGEPLTASQKIRKAVTLLRQTGAYNKPLRRWGRRPPAEHTWANFRLHFQEAKQEL